MYLRTRDRDLSQAEREDLLDCDTSRPLQCIPCHDPALLRLVHCFQDLRAREGRDIKGGNEEEG
jgi:hypothetical protein